MQFIIFGIIYIILAIIFIIYTILIKNKRFYKYLEDHNIMKGKIEGDVIKRYGGNEEHHAVIAYIQDNVMYKKECINGFNEKFYEVGQIVDIKCDPMNPENIEFIKYMPKAKLTIFEILIMIILLVSVPLMFISKGIFII